MRPVYVGFTLLCLVALAVYIFTCCGGNGSGKVLRDTWEGYKHFFIDDTGRVVRPRENDTVSEGQAYAMYRAVCMDDKEVFDRCYAWTEEHLSRKAREGDNLLSWHWKDGRVVDSMPASDADIDYAFSLILAESRWENDPPGGSLSYGETAKKVLADILTFETARAGNGRLYLTPWIMDNRTGDGMIPQNPSYYSPAHFRAFAAFTGDTRWAELVDTCYHVLGSLVKSFGGIEGVGLIPDWCAVDKDGVFRPLDGRSADFGWEAVRVPLRVAMDYYWFGSGEAFRFFENGFSRFVETAWTREKAIYCEYTYSGTAVKNYESPLFYTAYFFGLHIINSSLSRTLHDVIRRSVVRKGSYAVYESDKDYFVNSLTWFSEWIPASEAAEMVRMWKNRKGA